MKFIAAWPYGLGGYCIGHTHSSLAYTPGAPHWSSALVVKLAERISAATGQENGQENNRRNVEQL